MGRSEKRAVRYKSSSGVNQDAACPVCGLVYRDLRTGMTFHEVWTQFWKHNEDPSTWRNKRRRSVLGRWFEIKQGMFQEHVRSCQEDPVPF